MNIQLYESRNKRQKRGGEKEKQEIHVEITLETLDIELVKKIEIERIWRASRQVRLPSCKSVSVVFGSSARRNSSFAGGWKSFQSGRNAPWQSLGTQVTLERGQGTQKLLRRKLARPADSLYTPDSREDGE